MAKRKNKPLIDSDSSSEVSDMDSVSHFLLKTLGYIFMSVST